MPNRSIPVKLNLKKCAKNVAYILTGLHMQIVLPFAYPLSKVSSVTSHFRPKFFGLDF